MSDEKPRHERILARLSALVEDAVKRFSINADGGLTSFNNGSEFTVTGDLTPSGNRVITPNRLPPNRTPLGITSLGVEVNIGAVDGVVPTIGTVGIYGDGTPNSRPYLTVANMDIYVRMLITPESAADGFGGFFNADLIINAASIVTTAIDAYPSETLATLATATGVVTQGIYYYWMGQILDETVVLYPAPVTPREFMTSFGTWPYTSFTAGVQIGVNEPDIDYV